MMETAEVIQLEEETPLSISVDSFDRELARMLYYDDKKRISVVFPSIVTNNCYVFRSNGYVGYVPLNDKYAIKIAPKVLIQNIF